MALHTSPINFGLSGAPVAPGQVIAARPPLPGEGTSVTPATVSPDFLQKILGLEGDASSLDRLLAIIGNVFPTSGVAQFTGGGVGVNGGIGGLVGSILGLGKDKK